jgi:regulator of protease activity HflC (stomatin/prohibitin superfamily)
MGEKINFKISWITWFIVIGALVIVALSVIIPHYNVWEQSLQGKAELSRADYNRQIAVVEADAKLSAATKLAEAEVERAKGVASANKIIGDSLRQNEDYLRYLWITDVAGSNVDKTVVYVPTETNLPILEANRYAQTKA